MDTDAQDKWDEKNQWAMNYIYSSITNEQLEFVGDQDTALKIMRKFDEMYMKKSTAVQICIRSRLDMMRLKDFEESNSFFTEFEKTINELKSAGANVSEREKLDYMLKALPESLNYIGDLIDSVKESDQTCEFLKNKIIMWETRSKKESDRTKSNVFTAEKKDIKCYGCGKYGHMARNCTNTCRGGNNGGNNGGAQRQGNPEPKVLEVEPNREARKSVNVTINVGRNERNVEITEPVKKAKLDRTKFKPVPETYSPTRLSAKERLGEKVDENKERKISPIKSFLDRREMKSENQSRSRSPRSTRDKRISSLLDRRVDSSLTIPGSERKVFLDDRKRDNKDRGDRSKEGNDFRSVRHDIRSERDPRIDSRGDFRSTRNDSKGERIDKDREKDRDKERRGRTPSCTFKRNDIPKIGLLKSREEEDDRRRDKKRKEKKHKKDKEKNLEKKQKHKENIGLKDKPESNETKINYENPEPPATESIKKQRKNPRLVSDRKRSMLDEASFEPDYSASDSESDGEDGKVVSLPTKKLKLDEPDIEKEMDIKSLKKRSKSTSSEDSSSTSDSSTTDSDSSDESHKKKKKKHKKHKKKKSMKKDSSSDSDSYSDSSETK
ncbi:cylicin-1-like [Bombus huntii]|uniref:cylicin-1-like n=1 Tax=Bombus huntii TaxID=85661 RepID=UPI0021AABB00|nr:cylicin-1-like [Bombus huntii]